MPPVGDESRVAMPKSKIMVSPKHLTTKMVSEGRY